MIFLNLLYKYTI